MRQYRGLLRGQGTSIVDLYWAGCIINMSGFDLRQAQGSVDVRFGAHNGLKSDIAPCPKCQNRK